MGAPEKTAGAPIFELSYRPEMPPMLTRIF
jgi:hypothetical protein